jgi:hypothetical protein
MTKKQAFEMGYRHIADLAAMNRIAAIVNARDDDPEAAALMAAWRDGAMAARAMIERETATLQ